MDEYEILKSLLYDGEYTFGITIWQLIVIFMLIAIVISVSIRYKKLIGIINFSRRKIIRKSEFGGSVLFKVRQADYDTKALYSRVKESIATSLEGFDEQIKFDKKVLRNSEDKL